MGVRSSNDSERCDVVVIGAGIIGAACAFHLALRGLNVRVVEALNGYAGGSSGLSFASVRAQWADPLNIEISWRSIHFWRDFADEYGYDIGYQPNGYLFLIPDHAWERHLEAVELQRSFGVPVEVLTPEEAQQISQFDPDGLAGATWGTADGQVDPHGGTGAFLDLARKHGAEVVFRFPVDRVEALSDGSWRVGSGDRHFHCQYLVNAAGGWAGELGALAGFEIPVVHSRRNVFATAAGVAERYLPMTVDLETGFCFRTEGTRFLFLATRPNEPDGYNTQLDWDWVLGAIELGYDRFPWLGEVPLDRQASWAGTYENTPDHNAIVGPQPGATTWINVCGLSGHGVIQAPEMGRIVSELIVDGRSGYDLERLSIERFGVGSLPSESVSMVF